MFNIKWGGIAAGAAFVTALALSLLLGHTTLLIALLRAAVFGSLFFGLGLATWTLINTFIPDLLSAGAESAGGDIASKLFATGAAGSQVNITVDDAQSAALPEQDYGAADSGDVGNFNDLFVPKEDIDQTPATGYTEEGGLGEFASGEEFSPAADEGFASAFADAGIGGEDDEEESDEFSMDFSAFVPGGLGDGDAADDAEADSSADSLSFFPEAGGSAAFDEPAAPERKPSRNKPMKLEGDFDAKEIAAGLRTVLQKDNK